ncbi:DUF4336 domain-containing protein [Comamonas sp. Y33R10-2]|uniref:DUF4336 domain-containing protein n=1 Tax=Comamonas sp. Y33R10-2 TaxID=2853257 RepID=UPI001C5C87BB|nr:DUF4336 domain-containing protein [Comamonas sp. Y33R10-2]QXZ09733.1 DUF4336 domain-containing protein [Comamonas sp. Y33R10-2]
MQDSTEKWQAIADGVWSLSYHFSNAGMQVSTRMTVIRLADGGLFSHSAVPLSPAQKAALDAIGPLRHIVAPSAMHHLFVGKLAKLYPQARLYGTAGVLRKHPDQPLLEPLPAGHEAPWVGELQCIHLDGIPMLDETLWFHPASGSLIATDVLQCWQGPLSLPVRMYLGLAGGHERLTVPRTVRLLVRDKAAVRAWVQQVKNLPVQRVILLHNSVIDVKSKQRLDEALSIWD